MDSKVLNSQPLYPIRIAAKKLNISVHTIRMYEREGLVIPQKSKGNQRIYSDADLERINCIRNAINDSKISINGIKVILSMAPCWAIVKCSKEDQKKCDAFNGNHQPCWTYEKTGKKCEIRDCRECEVYINYADCKKVKELIKTVSG